MFGKGGMGRSSTVQPPVAEILTEQMGTESSQRASGLEGEL